MKESLDIRYMIDVGVKGGVLVMRRRIHMSERIDIPRQVAGRFVCRINWSHSYMNNSARDDNFLRPPIDISVIRY
jgi:hypothetical protein